MSKKETNETPEVEEEKKEEDIVSLKASKVLGVRTSRIILTSIIGPFALLALILMIVGFSELSRGVTGGLPIAIFFAVALVVLIGLYFFFFFFPLRKCRKYFSDEEGKKFEYSFSRLDYKWYTFANSPVYLKDTSGKEVKAICFDTDRFENRNPGAVVPVVAFPDGTVFILDYKEKKPAKFINLK